MHKKILYLFVLWECFSTVQGKAAPEVDILASPDYWGMARSGGAMCDLPDHVWINPSLIPDTFHYSLSAHLALMPGDIRVSQITGRYSLHSHVLSGGINYENYGEFEGFNADGFSEDAFHAGRTQIFAAWSYGLSSKLQVGFSYRYVSDKIATSQENFSVVTYGITLVPIKGKTRLSFAFTNYPENIDDEARFSITHPLRYLPVYVNVDYRYRGKHALENLTLGGYYLSDLPFEFLAGIDFRRGDLQTNALGQDYIAGLAIGSRYRYKSLIFQLSAFSYGGLGTVTTFGVNYYHGS